jgi:imidazolonepropionase-like amidohydrolase
LIDGTGAPAISNAVVVIDDNKITAVGSAGSVNIPANAKVIDLGDVTLLPVSSTRTRISIGRVLGDPAGENALVRDYASFAAILGVQHARATLMAGFTTVRNVGAEGPFDDMALRKAIDEGWTQGPRMVTAVMRWECAVDTAMRTVSGRAVRSGNRRRRRRWSRPDSRRGSLPDQVRRGCDQDLRYRRRVVGRRCRGRDAVHV